MKARLPKEYQGGQQNMQSMIKQAQKMQEDIGVLQEELNVREFSASVGGGVVEVTMTGDKTVKALAIKPEVVDPEDVDMLQDLIISAVNECLRTIETTTEAEMEKVTGGVNIPGMF